MATKCGKVCSICGEEKLEAQSSFLIAQSLSAERLSVLAWDDEVAHRPGIYAACSAAHVNELVVEWMVGTSPAFIAQDTSRRKSKAIAGVCVLKEPDIRGARQVAELCIDRAAVERALIRNPSALQILLDEFRDALDREVAGTEHRLESADSVPWLRQM